ncbi:ABC transporter permease [Mucilaginibacter sp. P25]|uniref:ABC transporter permease n=1 Tax=Mucilaginibacter sp. P25 TaxID=3423945 RepID=UPI003D7A11AB
MKGFILSFRSEFYKSRKTLGFWASVMLPLFIGVLLFVGFYTKSEKLVSMPPMMLWLQFAGAILGIMGSLVLPMYIIFIAYSVNSIEHRADTWKTLFNLPIPAGRFMRLNFFMRFSLYLFALRCLCCLPLVSAIC